MLNGRFYVYLGRRASPWTLGRYWALAKTTRLCFWGVTIGRHYVGMFSAEKPADTPPEQEK